MLSFELLGLLMDFSQDRFILDALGGKRGGEIDGVGDGDIYYIGMTSLAMIFLTWISKYKEGDLYATYGPFLFLGRYHTTMEGLFIYTCIILLSTYGKNIVFTSMDYLTQHFDALTIHIQCIAAQKGKFFIELHGQNWANLYDGDSHLLYGLGQVFSFMYVQLMYPSIYYLSVDAMTYIYPCNKKQLAM